jgi:hypothetical protein
VGYFIEMVTEYTDGSAAAERLMATLRATSRYFMTIKYEKVFP